MKNELKLNKYLEILNEIKILLDNNKNIIKKRVSLPCSIRNFFFNNTGSRRLPVYILKEEISKENINKAILINKKKIRSKITDKYKSKKDYIIILYFNLKRESVNKNIKFDISKKSLIRKFKNNSEFLLLYSRFKTQKFNLRSGVILRRVDKNKPYTIRNIKAESKSPPKIRCGDIKVKPSTSYKNRSVECINEDGEIISFNSVSEASRKLCITTVNIVQAASGQNYTCNKMIWRYTDGKEKKELINHNIK